MSNIINTSRLDNELEKDYILRLCDVKKINNWTWQDIADIVNEELECEYTASRYKSIYEREIAKNNKIIVVKDVLYEKTIELEKAKYKFYDQRTAYNKVIRDSSRAESIRDIIRNEIKEITPYETYYHYQNLEHYENDMVINLNDIHYDLIVDNYWNKYSPEIAKKRLDFYLEKIKQKRELFCSENCYLLLGGDNISGNIHKQIAIASREGIVKQIMGVSELIAWFVNQLQYLFNIVYVVGANGNHSRVEKKEDSSIHDRLDMITTWYLKARFNNNKNIIILDNDIDDTLSLFTIRGKNYVLVHGDLDGIKNPYKIIEMLGVKIEAIYLAHKHTNQLQWVQGIMCLMSGSLSGSDDWCVEKRINGLAQQLISIATKEGIEDLCNINLNIV